MDQVDRIIKQWNDARPELDTLTTGPLARLTRISKAILTREERNSMKYGINIAGFDVLSALRRSGKPYALSAGDLLNSMMITAGTMTNRIDQLVKAGLVERVAAPEDARKTIVQLTDNGFDVIETLIVDHLDTQRTLMAGLTSAEIEQLDNLLRKLAVSVESA
ncbi:MarR family transcriptional regulator [Providencia alcalifaciens]|uniref:MarR family winged helix-turn-helix transcriptional regulator n=1 Tax=Providencia alcalifaciens TaxID=126385 RepID=UPI001CE0A13F|nr:MarR family transcriptional regulator [Providencia alcalifaciens]